MDREQLSAGEVKALVEGLNFSQKVERSLGLIEEAYAEFGEGLVVANSLGKDSVAAWRLARQVSPRIRGFIVTTRYKPPETVQFMKDDQRMGSLRASLSYLLLRNGRGWSAGGGSGGA